MKRLAFPLIIAVGSVATPVAFAAPATHATMTCKQFVAIDEVSRPKVVYWAEGVSRKGRPQDAVMDIEETERLIPVVTEQCRRAPQASFMTKLEQSWDKVKNDIRRHV